MAGQPASLISPKSRPSSRGCSRAATSCAGVCSLGGVAHVVEVGAGGFFGFYYEVGEVGDLRLLVREQAGGVGGAERGRDKVEGRHGGLCVAGWDGVSGCLGGRLGQPENGLCSRCGNAALFGWRCGGGLLPFRLRQPENGVRRCPNGMPRVRGQCTADSFSAWRGGVVCRHTAWRIVVWRSVCCLRCR